MSRNRIVNCLVIEDGEKRLSSMQAIGSSSQQKSIQKTSCCENIFKTSFTLELLNVLTKLWRDDILQI